MRIKPDIKLDYKDVLLEPKRSQLTSRKDVEMEREFNFLHSGKKFRGTPIMASNMDGVGTFAMAKELQKHRMITVMRKHYTPDDWDNAVGDGVKLKYVSVCTGTGRIWSEEAQDYTVMKQVLNNYPDINFITIDVANGYHQNFIDFVKKVRDEYPDKTIIAGNVITAGATEELILSGADIVKCGIGPGSVCTTRLMTGVGVPQFSGILECADAAHGVGGQVIADGGCVYPGDVAKAFAAGSDFVMLGGMLAGHNEGGGNVVTKHTSTGGAHKLDNGTFIPHFEEQQFVQFYGMSSDAAMATHGSRKDGYRGAEGKLVSIPYKGKVENTLTEVLGGVRSACTYIGAKRIKDMPKCATFVQVNKQVNEVFNRYE
jgi:GMP reductase